MRFNSWNQSGRRGLRLIGLAALFAAAVSLVLMASGRLSLPTDRVKGAATPPASAVLGTNLSGISDWSTEMPFLDAFKSSRRWVTQCIATDPGCEGRWGTDEYDRLDLDEQGWVRSLPAPEDPPQYTRVATLLFRDVKRYPSGKYVVLYEGEGTIEYKYDARKNESESAPGRDVIDVTPSDKGIYLLITATDPRRNGNYIRNIHVVPAASEAAFADEIFNPQFIDKVKQFKAFRFMDWMDTNDSEQREWRNRPIGTTASYARGGVPIEWMVALVNRLDADPWFNMPHQATDEYMREFARLVRTTLEPERKVYVEYSNEVWNPQFEQFRWAVEQSRQEWGEDAPYQWAGKRAAQMCDIWKQVYEADRDRVVCVLGTQSAVPERAELLLNCPKWSEGPCYQHGIDAFAIAGYFGGNVGKPDYEQTVEAWLGEPDGGFGQLFKELRESSLLESGGLPQTFDRFRTYRALTQRYGLSLVVYEGGQHLVGRQGVENNDRLTNFFIEANRRPEMYDLYTNLLNEWQRAGGDLFMNFTDIGNPRKSGSWGVLEHVDQETSPKYQALLDFIDRTP